MKETIDAFIKDEHIAIVGASPNKDNFGLGLIKELKKEGKQVFPVNPGYDEVGGEKCYPTVKDLPENVENVVLVVHRDLSPGIVKECLDSNVKRVWLHQGVGKGAFSEEALNLLKEANMEYVYGFCPMMFLGKGMHKFHFWMRKNFGKKPVEFSLN